MGNIWKHDGKLLNFGDIPCFQAHPYEGLMKLVHPNLGYKPGNHWVIGPLVVQGVSGKTAHQPKLATAKGGFFNWMWTCGIFCDFYDIKGN